MEKQKFIVKVCEAELSDDKKTFLIDNILNGKLSVDGDFYFEHSVPWTYIIQCFDSGDVIIAGIDFDKKEIIVYNEIYNRLSEISDYVFADATIGIIQEVQYPIVSSTSFSKQDNISYLYDSVNVLPYMKFVFNGDYKLQYYSYVGSVNAETAHILRLLNKRDNTEQKNYIRFVDFFLSKVYFHTSEPILSVENIFIYQDDKMIFHYNSKNSDFYTLYEKELHHNNFIIPYNISEQKNKKYKKKQEIAYCDMFDSSEAVQDKHMKRFAKYVKSEIKLSNSNKVQFTLDKYESKHYKDWLQNLCANKGYKIKTKKYKLYDATDVTIRTY